MGKVEVSKNKILEENRMSTLKLELQQIIKMEEVSRTQKFSCLWLKEGDNNTKFFQRIANSH